VRVETSTGVSGQAVGQTHQQQVIQANGIRMNSMTLGEYVYVCTKTMFRLLLSVKTNFSQSIFYSIFPLIHSTSFTVNDQLASCKYVYIYVHEVDTPLTIVMDDMEMAVWESEAPTISPTYNPTLAEEFFPTASPSESPTTRPTVSDATVCPEELLTPVEVPSGPIMLARSSTLCLLTKAVPDADGNLSNVAPVAMSYDDRDWEKSAGDFSLDLLYGQSFGDYGDGSHITLPELEAGSKYYLTSYEHSVSETDQVAGLLETA